MRAWLLILALLLTGVPALAQDYDPAPIPDTPAGRFFSTWLNAYNSDDVATIEAYNQLYDRKNPPETWIEMHSMTGDLTPVRTTSTGPNDLTILLAPEQGDSFWQSMNSIDPNDPMKVLSAGLGPADRPAEFAIARLPKAELDTQMDALLDERTAADRFAGTVLVQRHGKIVYSAARGLADRTTGSPVTMDTKFRIGSANKMFTAIAILQLVQQGKIALDAPVGTYLPDYPNADFAGAVTVRQLLSHSGGAGEIFTDAYFARRLETKTHADYVALFGERTPDREHQNDYANYGFVLLGRIVEVVSGQDYYRFVRERIFAPAGMGDTGSLPEETIVAGRSRGYTKGEGGQLADNLNTLPFRGTAAGGGYTTAGDMIRFATALRNGQLISQELLTEATSPQHPDGWYGLGFFLSGQGPTGQWGHGGGAPGMNAAFRVLPELDATVVVLANLDPPAADEIADFYANRMSLEE